MAPAGNEERVTAAVEVVTTAPLAVSTFTTMLPIGEPAVPVVGWVVMASFVAVPPPLITIFLLTESVKPLEDAFTLKVPAVLKIKLLNVATPFAACMLRVPVTPPGEETMVIRAVEPVTTCPLAVSTCTTTLPMAVPVVPVVGCEVMTNFVAAAPITILELVAEVRPVEAAFSVKVPALGNVRLVNVAMPPEAFIVRVPDTPPGDEDMVIAAVEVVTKLPLTSSTCTTTLPMGVPALPVVGAVMASLVAVPPVIVMVELVALVRPVEAAVTMYEPAVLKIRLLKVATPFVAFMLVIPVTPLGDEVIAMAAVEVVTVLPLASSTVTTTFPIAVPAAPVEGCDVITSFVAVPLMVIAVLVAELRPVDDAVKM